MAATGRSRSSQDEALDRLGRLFDGQHQRIYNLARRMTRDPEAARDLLQETFLRAARRWHALPADDSGAEAWLVRTAVNLCRDLGRRRFVRDRDYHKIDRPTAWAPNPERRAVARAAVEVALAQLPPKRRAVVILTELEGHDSNGVAHLLGMPAATVRWHLSKARKHLRSTLETKSRESNDQQQENPDVS
jgi:RNA polymerase sigma-70 factor (ECF subfamily)